MKEAMMLRVNKCWPIQMYMQAMKEAMMSAPLGDDVFKDDPTVNLFEQRVSQYLYSTVQFRVASFTTFFHIQIYVSTKFLNSLKLNK